MKTLLFTYGTLRPGYSTPKTTTDAMEDSIRGTMTTNQDGFFTVSRDFARISTEIHGYTLVIDDSELGVIDEYEGELYERVEVRTHKLGLITWAYVERKKL
mgnify:CR=1 FL=1